MPPKPVRVRFGPSPTGYLHIGGARTALFNYLFAKQSGGQFLLRIEDTDTERSEKQYEDDILEQLKWIGLHWDELYRQTERLDLYEKYLKQLLEARAAYHCFCSKEEVEAYHEALRASGEAPRYSGTCRTLDMRDAARRLGAGDRAVIRFRMPAGKITFHDLIRGEVSFDGASIGDIVIAKGIREPLYNFAAAVDDHEMRISHVIRGEEHLSNTPRQIALYEALGVAPPKFAHLPLILNPDRSKMSKRFAATAVREYRAQGYLPEALVNFMALLGWHPAPESPAGDTVRGRSSERELFTLEELIAAFDLTRVQKAGAVFSVEKLDWVSGQYLKRMDSRELLARLRAHGVVLDSSLTERQLLAIVALTRERMRTLAEFPALTDFFFSLPDYPDELLIWKKTPREVILKNLKRLRDVVSDAQPSQLANGEAEALLGPIAEAEGRGEVLWPLRAALSGRDASPGPYDILRVLGKEEGLRRVEVAIEKLSNQ